MSEGKDCTSVLLLNSSFQQHVDNVEKQGEVRK